MNRNRYTFPAVLKACGMVLALRECDEMHFVAVKSQYISNTQTGTTLVELYSSQERVECSLRWFRGMLLLGLRCSKGMWQMVLWFWVGGVYRVW